MWSHRCVCMAVYGRARARLCVCVCVCVCEEKENATLNAGRTKIYCYQLLTPCPLLRIAWEAICKSFLKLSLLLYTLFVNYNHFPKLSLSVLVLIPNPYLTYIPKLLRKRKGSEEAFNHVKLCKQWRREKRT